MFDVEVQPVKLNLAFSAAQRLLLVREVWTKVFHAATDLQRTNSASNGARGGGRGAGPAAPAPPPPATPPGTPVGLCGVQHTGSVQ